MQSLYEEAIRLVEELREARLKAVRLAAELAKAEYDLRVAQARVERHWIRQAGGEKNLAPTVEDRTRIFTLALDSDEEYRARRERRDALALQLEEVQVEVEALRNRLRVVLVAMGAGEVPEAFPRR